MLGIVLVSRGSVVPSNVPAMRPLPREWSGSTRKHHRTTAALTLT
jgi:hypothetical protein